MLPSRRRSLQPEVALVVGVLRPLLRPLLLVAVVAVAEALEVDVVALAVALALEAPAVAVEAVETSILGLKDGVTNLRKT